MSKKPVAAPSPAAPEPGPIKLLSLNEVAEALGLSRRTIAAFVASGKLASLTLGRSRRVRSDVLGRALEKGL